MPHTLRSIAVADEQAAELSMLCGFDDHLAKQATAASNRIRGLLTQIHRSWNAPSDRTWTTPPWPNCCKNTRPRTPCSAQGRTG
jgi:hypothetical protein